MSTTNTTIKFYSLLAAIGAALAAKNEDREAACLAAACELASFSKKTLSPVANQELKGLDSEQKSARSCAARLRKVGALALAYVWPFLAVGQRKDVSQRLGGELKAVRLNATGNGYAHDYRA